MMAIPRLRGLAAAPLGMTVGLGKLTARRAAPLPVAPQRSARIDQCRSARWHRRGSDARNARDSQDGEHDASIERSDAVEQTRQQSRQRERPHEPNHDARADHQPRFSRDERYDLPWQCAERHANGKLATALRHEVREHGVRAGDGEQ